MLDRIRESLRSLIRDEIPVDTLALYEGTVVTQKGDKSIDVKTDDPRFGPGFSGIPIKWGVPGISALVPPGTRVLVGFEGGRRDRPHARVWGTGNPLAITITAPSVTMRSEAVTVTGALVAGSISAAGLSAGPTGLSASCPSLDLNVSDPTQRVRLGGGGKQVARKGDAVEFEIACPYSGLPHIKGAISEGSEKVEAG